LISIHKGQKYHSSCLKCCSCNKKLTNDDIKFHKEQLFCRKCYTKLDEAEERSTSEDDLPEVTFGHNEKVSDGTPTNSANGCSHTWESTLKSQTDILCRQCCEPFEQSHHISQCIDCKYVCHDECREKVHGECSHNSRTQKSHSGSARNTRESKRKPKGEGSPPLSPSRKDLTEATEVSTEARASPLSKSGITRHKSDHSTSQMKRPKINRSKSNPDEMMAKIIRRPVPHGDPVIPTNQQVESSHQHEH